MIVGQFANANQTPRNITVTGANSVSTINVGGVNYSVNTFTTISNTSGASWPPATPSGTISYSKGLLSLEFLLVGGGGNGGSGALYANNGGGGGAGGVFENTLTLFDYYGPVRVVVGAAQYASALFNYSNNIFYNDTFYLCYAGYGGWGGGYSAAPNGYAGATGASGGGGGPAVNNAGGSAIFNAWPYQDQGRNGAAGNPASPYQGGGGGGASQAGNSNGTGYGGNGKISSITGTSIYYGGGGGGGADSSPGGGGAGGGGAGTVYSAGYGSPANYYGGGGGGGASWSNSIGGGAGYQGIIIIRYRIY